MRCFLGCCHFSIPDSYADLPASSFFPKNNMPPDNHTCTHGCPKTAWKMKRPPVIHAIPKYVVNMKNCKFSNTLLKQHYYICPIIILNFYQHTFVMCSWTSLLWSSLGLGKHDLISEVTLLAGLISYILLNMGQIWDYPMMTVLLRWLYSEARVPNEINPVTFKQFVKFN